MNEREDLLEENQLQLLFRVSDCHTEDYITTVKALVHSTKNIAAVLGPSCSSTNMIIGQLVSRRKLALPHLHTSVSPLLNDQRKYRNSYGLLGTTVQVVEALVALTQQNKWGHISVIVQYQIEFFHSLLLELQEELVKHNTTIQTLPTRENIPLEAVLGSGNRILMAFLESTKLSRLLCLLHYHHIKFPSYQLIAVTQGVLQNTSVRELTCNLTQIVSSAQDLGTVFLYYQLSQANSLTPAKQITLNRGPLYYDAVWALSLALNSSMEALETELGLRLSDYHYGNENATNIIQKEILSLSFEGLSGHIQFHNKTRFTARHIILYQIETENQTFFPIGAYGEQGLVYNSNIKFIEDTFEGVMQTQQVPLALAATVLLITVLVHVSVVTTHTLTVSLRHRKAVKASSPLLTQLAYIACYILGAGTVISCLQQVLPLSPSAYCSLYQVEMWTTFTGYTGLFGTLAVKTWRLYRIFVHVWQPGNRWLLSDLTLGVIVLCLLSLTLVTCVVWTVTDPLSPEGQQQVAKSEGTPVLLVTVTCTSPSYRVWFGVLLGYNTALLICTMVLAWLTRNIKRQFFNTNTYFYLAIVVLITGSPTYGIHMVNPSGKLEFILVTIFLNVTVLVCLVLLFLPPIVHVLKKKLKQHQKQKYLQQFEMDMNRIAEGRFKVVRRQDTFDYRDIRSVLLRFPYTSRSRRNSVHMSPFKVMSNNSTENLSTGSHHCNTNPRTSRYDSIVDSVTSRTSVTTMVSLEGEESSMFVNMMSLQELESEEELERTHFPQNTALHTD